MKHRKELCKKNKLNVTFFTKNPFFKTCTPTSAIVYLNHARYLCVSENAPIYNNHNLRFYTILHYN